MALTYEQLTEILMQVGPRFTIEETRPDGTRHVYRGHDVTAFVQRGDGRLHEHRVIDPQGNLVYRRDANGRLYVGNAEQWRKSIQRQKVGYTALEIFADSARRALRWWGMARR